MPERIAGLPPIARPDARVLILGSMPGAESLRRQQYYAHPRNRFWDLMGALAGAGRDLPYAARGAALAGRGIALWDVVRTCERPGSMDADIRASEPNDFGTFFAGHPGLRAVFFNGTAAAALFRRLVSGAPADVVAGLHVQVLPSTSPANARWSTDACLAAWRRLLDFLD